MDEKPPHQTNHTRRTSNNHIQPHKLTGHTYPQSKNSNFKPHGTQKPGHRNQNAKYRPLLGRMEGHRALPPPQSYYLSIRIAAAPPAIYSYWLTDFLFIHRYVREFQTPFQQSSHFISSHLSFPSSPHIFASVRRFSFIRLATQRWRQKTKAAAM